MSRFYGSLTGQAKTTATRRGGPSSGVEAHVRGWEIGVRTQVYDYNGQDRVRVYVTSGSNGRTSERQVGEWVMHEDGFANLLETSKPEGA
jgi:hypothetical protein